MSKTILIYNSGGGLGDSIQLLPFLETLKHNFSESNLYYLGAHENHFNNKLKDYGIQIDTLNLNIKYFGFRFWHYFAAQSRFKKLNLDKINVIIDLQSKLRNTLILKKLPHEKFYSKTLNHFFSKPKVNYSKANDMNNLIYNISLNLDKKLAIKDYQTNRIDRKFYNEAKKILPNKSYIGFSLTQGNIYRKKNWPIEKFIRLANLLVSRNKVPVFFIEKKFFELADKIKRSVTNAIIPEMESQLFGPAFVTALSSRCEGFITIDNGVMHMASLAKIPMIILFGPTNAEKFAPKNENVIILDSKKLYNSKDINKITLEDVLKYF